MIAIDCPWCEGTLSTDSTLHTVSCETCAIAVDIAPDPAPVALAPAA